MTKSYMFGDPKTTWRFVPFLIASEKGRVCGSHNSKLEMVSKAVCKAENCNGFPEHHSALFGLQQALICCEFSVILDSR